MSATPLPARLGELRIRFANTRRAGRKIPRYVIVSLDGALSEFSPPLSPLLRLPFSRRLPIAQPNPLGSISAIRRQFEQIAADPRLEGIVLKLGCTASASMFQSLRTIIQNTRAAGKRVVVYAKSFTPFQYYLACGCDQIVMPPPAEWTVTGFAEDYQFFKDALDSIGVDIEVVNISPYKSAGDQFVRNDFSAESRSQAEWLQAARWQTLIDAICAGRNMAPERAIGLINGAPYGAHDAQTNGLIDAVLYEDELERWLVPDDKLTPVKPPNRVMAWLQKRAGMEIEPDAREPQLAHLDEITGDLLLPKRPFAAKRIGVICIEGTILDGESQSFPVPLPLVGGRTVGDETVSQLIRKAERDKSLAGIVLYVNSPGGSAQASDLMARELKRLDKKKPIVTYMGGVAASGGYFVAAPTRYIVAQPLTITGSIGVFLTKPSLARAFEKIKVHSTVLKHGERADAFGALRPFTPDERMAAHGLMRRVYDNFKNVVAQGRSMPIESLDPVCEGRVWTGAQAHGHHLVDALGDFTVALARAAELAGLPADPRPTAILISSPKDEQLLPALWPVAAWLRALQPAAIRATLARPRTWAILPFDLID